MVTSNTYFDWLIDRSYCLERSGADYPLRIDTVSFQLIRNELCTLESIAFAWRIVARAMALNLSRRPVSSGEIRNHDDA